MTKGFILGIAMIILFCCMTNRAEAYISDFNEMYDLRPLPVHQTSFPTYATGVFPSYMASRFGVYARGNYQHSFNIGNQYVLRQGNSARQAAMNNWNSYAATYKTRKVYREPTYMNSGYRTSAFIH